MATNQPTCPKCGAGTVQGQLVPVRDADAATITAILSQDMAAGILAGQSGKLAVQAFCVTCGAIWLPAQENLIRAFRGEYGEPSRSRARQELEEMVKRGGGFKLVSDEDKRLAAWAKGVLSSG